MSFTLCSSLEHWVYDEHFLHQSTSQNWSRALGRKGSGERLDGGFQRSRDLRVWLEGQDYAHLRTSRGIWEGRYDHGQVCSHGGQQPHHALSVVMGLFLMLVLMVMVVMLVLMQVRVLVVVVQSKLMVMLMGVHSISMLVVVVVIR